MGRRLTLRKAKKGFGIFLETPIRNAADIAELATILQTYVSHGDVVYAEIWPTKPVEKDHEETGPIVLKGEDTLPDQESAGQESRSLPSEPAREQRLCVGRNDLERVFSA